jgi:hypothetical protein
MQLCALASTIQHDQPTCYHNLILIRPQSGRWGWSLEEGESVHNDGLAQGLTDLDYDDVLRKRIQKWMELTLCIGCRDGVEVGKRC